MGAKRPKSLVIQSWPNQILLMLLKFWIESGTNEMFIGIKLKIYEANKKSTKIKTVLYY